MLKLNMGQIEDEYCYNLNKYAVIFWDFSFIVEKFL